jgi:serine/threonine protein kinase
MPSAAAADRNLLFGILALQMDFISRDQLVAAMNAWVLDKAQPLAALLEKQQALSAERRALLDALVAEHLRQHGNDPHQSLAAVSSASSVRAELQRIADPDVHASLAHMSKPPDESANPAGSDPYATVRARPTAPAGLRYRILRPHAQGGLGEVFVAEDTELNRHVALKEIRNRHADNQESRSRFLLEAEITGGLEHPGIVPVYGLGTYADGRPFYAMRFIKGDNLKEAMERYHQIPTRKRGVEREQVSGAESVADASGSDFTSVAFRKLLGRFIDVCNAIGYAHSRGVLHRDLKPGNIMLGKYGETLVVDWGLAKPQGKSEPEASATEPAESLLRPASGSDVAETVAGAAIGTPAYMSPEQAAGKLDQLGPGTDVYSLGATLFTLLTNRPPVEEKDTAEVLRKVQRGEAGFSAPVSPPRKQGIPTPLVATCTKAMALRPADRYASALALAEDVEHWLADEPVAACREPAVVRVRRWMRKHPAAVSGIAAAVLVAVVGLGIGAVVLGEKNQLLSHANT